MDNEFYENGRFPKNLETTKNPNISNVLDELNKSITLNC